jgi:uncharacterized protein YycO
MGVNMQLASIVVTEGHGFLARQIQRSTRSLFTHAFLVTGEDELVEAWVPRIRRHSLSARLQELHREKRTYGVLEYPGLDELSRRTVAAKAGSYVGRRYDVLQAALYGLLGQFWRDGEGRMVCSRLIAASFIRGIGVDLFDDAFLEARYPPDHPRLANLRNGYATPPDLLCSRLEAVRSWRPGGPVSGRDSLGRNTPAAFGSSAQNPVGSST